MALNARGLNHGEHGERIRKRKRGIDRRVNSAAKWLQVLHIKFPLSLVSVLCVRMARSLAGLGMKSVLTFKKSNTKTKQRDETALQSCSFFFKLYLIRMNCKQTNKQTIQM